MKKKKLVDHSVTLAHMFSELKLIFCPWFLHFLSALFLLHHDKLYQMQLCTEEDIN